MVLNTIPKQNTIWSDIKFDEVIEVLREYLGDYVLSVLIYDSNENSEILWNLFCEFIKSKEIIDNAYNKLIYIKENRT